MSGSESARLRVSIDVRETSRLVVDHYRGHVFINQYMIIKDLGKGMQGTVKLCLDTQSNSLYAMKVAVPGVALHQAGA
jgi:serine/threonine protein kinase